MTNTQKTKPIFVAEAPKGATLVGRIEDKDSLPVDTSIVSSLERFWNESLYGHVKESLADRAATRYATRDNVQLLLVETANSGAQFDVAGIRYRVVADIYRA